MGCILYLCDFGFFYKESQSSVLGFRILVLSFFFSLRVSRTETQAYTVEGDVMSYTHVLCHFNIFIRTIIEGYACITVSLWYFLHNGHLYRLRLVVSD